MLFLRLVLACGWVESCFCEIFASKQPKSVDGLWLYVTCNFVEWNDGRWWISFVHEMNFYLFVSTMRSSVFFGAKELIKWKKLMVFLFMFLGRGMAKMSSTFTWCSIMSVEENYSHIWDRLENFRARRVSLFFANFLMQRQMYDFFCNRCLLCGRNCTGVGIFALKECRLSGPETRECVNW